MAQLSLLSSLFSWLPRWVAPLDAAPTPAPAPAPLVPAASRSAFQPDPVIAWGAQVTGDFKRKTIAISRRLNMDPNHLMAIMAFETGRSFDPAITNHAGSGATGLIQFMPATAKGLGTTTARLATMSAVDQLDYVETYLTPYAGRMGDLPSAYMAVLYPRAVDKEPDYVLFRKGSVAYKLNRGLDTNGNGHVTKLEAAAKVEALLAEGLRPGMRG
ncbi:MAG: lytic transglycosylase domain-containing protein [Hoeflea sp.]|uniref:transglycosylase SLT domain-containing protein n=1 Tax=Hoeflea sp. TaxID=1940281 RepID=UPI001D6C1026|nr:transglycosylase SLT domain-containing protein [Hoeflea sp.]MBU4527898.1 lytic transglycosylase domain-containing protein [Alphaproteobacteria bacterium]MBU4546067.1 lytic transglycosylase domain-containing protein [Alphaproteobacteria bacterium]MBU4553248.1 lytic transglycosylase domain-containing protein [Alphaproteobacteria bacterium]MBV1724320.1 lytic transglycosylase domain-containing protein [Hoeflea sp.]MBV1763316.1 lytic transglycosylase domain-containing protein [Hoeflea sp.]